MWPNGGNQSIKFTMSCMCTPIHSKKAATRKRNSHVYPFLSNFRLRRKPMTPDRTITGNFADLEKLATNRDKKRII